MEAFNKEMVRELRKKAKMSQETLAYKMGRKKLTIGNIESGYCKLNIDSLCLMAHIFKVPVSTFFIEEKE